MWKRALNPDQGAVQEIAHDPGEQSRHLYAPLVAQVVITSVLLMITVVAAWLVLFHSGAPAWHRCHWATSAHCAIAAATSTAQSPAVHELSLRGGQKPYWSSLRCRNSKISAERKAV